MQKTAARKNNKHALGCGNVCVGMDGGRGQRKDRYLTFKC